MGVFTFEMAGWSNIKANMKVEFKWNFEYFDEMIFST